MKTLHSFLVRNAFLVGILCWGCTITYGQQEPQYTHYQFNTMAVNPAYTGSIGHLAITTLYRDQWAGLEGAPKTISIGIDSPFGIINGIGLSLVRDELGPAEETFIDINYAYGLILNEKDDHLALGLKAGGKFLNVDWSKGSARDPEAFFNENINSEFLPTIGLGLFFYNENYYVGLSTPNLLANKTYDEIEGVVGEERTHYYIIGGYVFTLSENLKFKPSTFIKFTQGSPLIADFSANFLLYDKLNLGVSYRWDDSLSALVGFNISEKLTVGYAYDYTTTRLQDFNSGSHEVFLRYQFIPAPKTIKSPRFF